MRFPGIFVYLCFPALFAADPYRDPYGIWAGGFWPLGLFPFLCSGHFVPLCSIWVAALLGPDTCPERPHAGVLWVWAVVFSPRFPPSFRSEIGGFFSLKRNDLQFFATRVRIRHGGDFRRGYGNILALRKGEATTPAQLYEDTKCPPQHCDKHSIAHLSHRNKYAFQRVQGSRRRNPSAFACVFLFRGIPDL